MPPNYPQTKRTRTSSRQEVQCAPRIRGNAAPKEYNTTAEAISEILLIPFALFALFGACPIAALLLGVI